MSTRRALVFVVCVGACESLDVGLASPAATTTGSAAASSDATSAADDAPARETTSGGTVGADASGSAASESGSTDTGATTQDDATTGGGLAVGPCDAEQEICALVELDGEITGHCGETLELKGITQLQPDGRWLIEDCGGCELCGGPRYDITFAAPAGWEPTPPPLCSRVAIDFEPMNATPWACAFVGIAIFSDDGLGEDPAPVYIAASIRTEPPSALVGLVVDPQNVDADPCPRSSCCWETPGKYAFTFSGAGLGQPLTLAEHEEALDVGMFGRSYDARNLRSHVHPECGDIPHLDWVFRR